MSIPQAIKDIDLLRQRHGTHELPELGYPADGLEPGISAETLRYHHGKHHAGYVRKLNNLVESTDYEGMPLERIIAQASGPLFNNAAQHFNHAFYWKCLHPDGGGDPPEPLAKRLTGAFGSVDAFRSQFSESSATLFGSGWCWLVADEKGAFGIEQMANAGCPLARGWTPLLTCDVWEHAYYIDRRNDRKAYIEAFWELVDWRFVEACLEVRTR